MPNSLVGPAGFAPIPPEIDRVSREIIGAAIEVHRQLRPGLLEGVYGKAMVREMRL